MPFMNNGTKGLLYDLSPPGRKYELQRKRIERAIVKNPERAAFMRFKQEDLQRMALRAMKPWEVDELIEMDRNERAAGNATTNREEERLAQMGLDKIWRQPTPLGNANPVAFDIVNPTPPAVFGSHRQLPDPTLSVHPSTSNGGDYVPRGWYQPAPGPPAYPTSSHALSQSYQPYNYDAEPHHPAYYAPVLHHPSIQPDQVDYHPFVHPQSMPAAQPTRQPTINESLATWYAEQVVAALVVPGNFRRGADGSSDEVWGDAGVVRASFTRLQQLPVEPPHQSPPRYGQPINPRDASREVYDPWSIMWKHRSRVSDRLVNFIHELLERMSIGPTAVMAAVWYIQGFGLHAGDGEKGRVIRKLLAASYSSDDEAVERRVVMLGLLFAGKWLDDNSFMTNQWSELSHIPLDEIKALEFAALTDIHCSLYISPSSWLDHVNKRWAELEQLDLRNDPMGAQVLALLEEQVALAQPEYYDEEYYFTQQSPQYHSRGSTPVSQWFTPRPDHEMMDAARVVDALVEDEMGDDYEIDMVNARNVVDALVGDGMEYENPNDGGLQVFEDDGGEESEDESEDEFLDYDGAKRFLPTISEIRRTESDSSNHSDAITEWRDQVRAAATASEGCYSDAGSEVDIDCILDERTPPPRALRSDIPRTLEALRQAVCAQLTPPPSPFDPLPQSAHPETFTSRYTTKLTTPEVPTEADDSCSVRACRASLHVSPHAHDRLTSSEGRMEPIDHGPEGPVRAAASMRHQIMLGMDPLPVPSCYAPVYPAPQVHRGRIGPQGSNVPLSSGTRFNPAKFIEPIISCRQPLNPLPRMENWQSGSRGGGRDTRQMMTYQEWATHSGWK